VREYFDNADLTNPKISKVMGHYESITLLACSVPTYVAIFDCCLSSTHPYHREGLCP